MKPPVEAPTSRQSRPATSSAKASSAFASLWPARDTYGGGASTSSGASSSTCSPAFAWPRHPAGEDERLRLGTALGEAALDEQDVEPLPQLAPPGRTSPLS